MPELSYSQQLTLGRMISDSKHPDTIDAFLAANNFTDDDIANYYFEANLRRSHLLACYRMKRNIRLIGVGIVAYSAVIPFIGGFIGGPILISVGMAAYGIGLIITGSFTIFQ